MTLEADTKFTIIENKNLVGTTYLLIPKEITEDSQYNFSSEDVLTIKIIGDKILIEKKRVKYANL